MTDFYFRTDPWNGWGIELFKEMAVYFHAEESKPLILGNTAFWIDSTGPWAGEISFSLPPRQWDAQAIGKSAAHLAESFPAVRSDSGAVRRIISVIYFYDLA
jgi:hypothetical protein